MKTWIVLILTALTVSAQDTNIDTSILLIKHGKETAVDRFHENQGVTATKLKHIGWSAIRIPPGQEQRLKDNYSKSRIFQRVEYGRTYYVDVVPNDPLYSQMWGLAKIQASSAWDTTTSNDVIVAVIDTGVDFNHPDLIGNLWTGPSGEHGYTASGGFLTIGGQDDHSHGTHVAGTIGAVGNNGIGVPGINWGVKIAAFKFIGPSGTGSSLDAALCIDRMIDLKLAGHNIRVSNNSWGALTFDSLLQDAFMAAGAAGILNVCAAGNNNLDTDFIDHSPASLPVPEIISVLASDENDAKAGFSNYGTASTDLLAPGVNILSVKLNGDYWLLSGTSMASPHVAGVCAAMFGMNPNLTPKQCKDVLLDPDSFDSTELKRTSTYGGRLNFAKCVTTTRLFNPPNNHNPILSLAPTNYIRIFPNLAGTMTANGFDQDGDGLRYNSSLVSALSDGWLVGLALGKLRSVQPLDSNRLTVTNRPIGIDSESSALFSASDGHGGGAKTNGAVLFTRDESLVKQLQTADISMSADAFMSTNLFISVTGLNPDDGYASYFISMYGIGYGVLCCSPLSTEWPMPRWPFSTNGPSVIRAQVMDKNGNFVNSRRLLLDLNKTGKYVPEIKLTVSTNRGIAPLLVTANMTETDPNNEHQLQYFARYWDGSDYLDLNRTNQVKTFTLTTLGLHQIEFLVWDQPNNMIDAHVEIFSVLPTDVTPPEPILIAPSNLAVALSGLTLSLSWLDRSIGEDRQELQLRTKFKGPWSAFRTLALLNENVQAFSVTAQRKTQYEFRVKACKNLTCSSYSNTASIPVR